MTRHRSRSYTYKGDEGYRPDAPLDTVDDAYATLAGALAERGFGADVWDTGGHIMAVAATIDGRRPSAARRHMLITDDSGSYLIGFFTGNEEHDNGSAALVSLDALGLYSEPPKNDSEQSLHTATANQVADAVADMIVSLVGRNGTSVRTRARRT